MSACASPRVLGPSAPPRRARSASRPPSRASAVRAAESSSSAGALGDGWTASQVAAFADSPETRALVTCDLLELKPAELCPELPMYLLRDGDDIVELWARTESFFERARSADAKKKRASPLELETGARDSSLHPPYWAVPWVGGQGVARYILDHPEVVRGKTVLDVGSGCGVAALAAARAGASSVCANDVDPLAAVAFFANAEACDVARLSQTTLETSVEDLLRRSAEDVARFDVIMAGDVCFMKGLAEAFQAWLAEVSRRKPGAVTILGDPTRREQWAPKPGWAEGMRAAATYEVRTAKTSALTEGQEVRNTVVWLSEATTTT
jgi:predicted nicotinamide N-methyase